MSNNGAQAVAPLAGVRVVNIGTRWAGRVAAMLLADQGAEVIEVVRPGRETHAADALLDRGKRLVTLDLKSEADRERCLAVIAEADIVLENMRAGAAAALGLDYLGCAGAERRLVYVSLPGFAAGDENRDVPAWEGGIDAASGIYTDLSPLGPLIGGDPVYTAIPMASAYGGVLGALTATMGLYHRQTTGRGQRFEVPLADAVMAAMALLIAKIEDQPARYNIPPIDNDMMHVAMPILRDLRAHMTADHVQAIADYLKRHAAPGFNFYEGSDGRLLFIVASDHGYQTRTFLEVVGVLDQLLAEGMVCESPFSEARTGNNVLKASDLSPQWRRRVLDLVAAKVKQKPVKEWEALLRAANVPATMVQTTDEWLADPVLRAAGVTTDVADGEASTVRQAGRFVSIEGEGVASPALAPSRNGADGLAWASEAIARPAADAPARGLLAGVKVLDFSNIIAGPAAGRTLAEHGAEVIRVDSPTPQAGPYATLWFGIDVNQGKQAIILDLKSEAGRAALEPLIKQADVVLHNYLDGSARALGIAHDQLTAVNPDIISCQISAWGGADHGDYANDPAFDPVLQAASGIMARYGTLDVPRVHGIASCVDYITGFSAALGIVQALVARALGRGGSYVRTSLAMGAQLVQFPFMAKPEGGERDDRVSGQAALGDGAEQRLYRVADGWAFVGCRPGDAPALAEAVGANGPDAEAIATAIARLPLSVLRERLAAVPGAGAIAARCLRDIRDDRTVDDGVPSSNWMNSGSVVLRRGPHPSGHETTVPAATWIRPDESPVSALYPAPEPGADTVSVLKDAGLDAAAVDTLLASGAALSRWPVVRRYLPR